MKETFKGMNILTTKRSRLLTLAGLRVDMQVTILTLQTSWIANNLKSEIQQIHLKKLQSESFTASPGPWQKTGS